MNNIFKCSALNIMLLIFLLNGCKKPDEITHHVDKEEFSIEEQKQVGDNLAAMMAQSENNYKILDRDQNATFYTYVNQLWLTAVNTQIVETRTSFDWEVVILEDDEMRSAFSIPGGKIYIYTGLLKTLGAENELFGILAHELYYIEKGIVLEAMIAEYGSLIIGDIWLNTQSEGAKDVAETIHNLHIPDYRVSQADQFALEIICPFQYEARGLKTFIESVNENEINVKWLTIRPGQQGRLEHIDLMASNCGEEEETFITRYNNYKELLP